MATLHRACALVLAVAGCASAQPPRPAAPPGQSVRACVLVDSDAGLDDFRAIASLVGTGALAGVVVTEGLATPDRGAAAVAHLLAAADLPNPIPVVAGARSPEPEQNAWLPDDRDHAERLNGVLSVAVARAPSDEPFDARVARWVEGCTEVRVLVLGPFSSFARYRPRLGDRVRAVVAQGVALAEVPDGARPPFNCRYDLAACRAAQGAVTAWVALPRGGAERYVPNAELFARLGATGLQGTLRAVFDATPAEWAETQLWDDAAALYLLHPGDFATRGAHLEPAVPADALRARWLEAVGRTR